MARTTGSTAELTRERILEAARELFAERGYAGTSIRDIAERLRMTKAALYYHFPGKQDVLAALVEPWLLEIDALAAWAERHQPVDRQEALRKTIAYLAAPNPTFSLLITDPSAMHDSATRLNARARMRRLERALAGDDDRELLAVRCALGAVRSGTLGTLLARGGDDRALTQDELDAILEAGLAAWNAAAPPS